MPVSADNDMPEQRILHAGLRERVTGAAQAAALIRHGETVDMCGFYGSG